MTAPTWLPEHEEELSRAPAVTQMIPKATGPGIAEIKKHNPDGIKKGLAQLAAGVRQLQSRGAVRRQRYLVTYLPVDANDVPTETRSATHLRVFAIEFTRAVPESTQGLLNRTWMDLGKVAIPVKAKPLLSPGREAAFGRAVEGAVRECFLNQVVRPRVGGRKPRQHDVVWDELAEFYSQLARELAAESGSFRF